MKDTSSNTEESTGTCIWVDEKGVRCRNDQYARGICKQHYHACNRLVKDKSKPGIDWDYLEEQGLVLGPKVRFTDTAKFARKQVLELFEKQESGRRKGGGRSKTGNPGAGGRSRKSAVRSGRE